MLTPLGAVPDHPLPLLPSHVVQRVVAGSSRRFQSIVAASTGCVWGGYSDTTAQSQPTAGVCHATLHSCAPAFPTPRCMQIACTCRCIAAPRRPPAAADVRRALAPASRSVAAPCDVAAMLAPCPTSRRAAASSARCSRSPATSCSTPTTRRRVASFPAFITHAERAAARCRRPRDIVWAGRRDERDVGVHAGRHIYNKQSPLTLPVLLGSSESPALRPLAQI